MRARPRVTLAQRRQRSQLVLLPCTQPTICTRWLLLRPRLGAAAPRAPQRRDLLRIPTDACARPRPRRAAARLGQGMPRQPPHLRPHLGFLWEACSPLLCRTPACELRVLSFRARTSRTGPLTLRMMSRFWSCRGWRARQGQQRAQDGAAGARGGRRSQLRAPLGSARTSRNLTRTCVT